MKHRGCLPVFRKSCKSFCQDEEGVLKSLGCSHESAAVQPQPSWYGKRGGDPPKLGRGGGKKPQAGASWQDCKNAVVFRFPFSPSPLLWPSSFTCPSPSIPGAAYSAKKFGERDDAASPRWEREQWPQPRLPSAWLPWGAPGNIVALGYPLMGGEVRQGCTKH